MRNGRGILSMILMALTVLPLLSQPSQASVTITLESHYGDNVVYEHDRYPRPSIIVDFDRLADYAELAIAETEISWPKLWNTSGNIGMMKTGLNLKGFEYGEYTIRVYLNYTVDGESYNVSEQLTLWLYPDFEVLDLSGPSEITLDRTLVSLHVNLSKIMHNVTVWFFGGGVEFDPETVVFDQLPPDDYIFCSWATANVNHPLPTGFYTVKISGQVGNHSVSFTMESVDVTFDRVPREDTTSEFLILLGIAAGIAVAVILIFGFALRKVEK